MRVVSFICLLCVICQSAFAQETKTINCNGNTLLWGTSKPDTFTIVDPETGKEKIVIKVKEGFTTLNGRDIYHSNSDINSSNDRFIEDVKDKLYDYFVKNLKTSLQPLSDALYTIDISNIIINEQGKIVYYDKDDIINYTMLDDVKSTKIDDAFKKNLNTKIEKLTKSAPASKSLQTGGMVLPYTVDVQINFSVKNHKVII